MLPSVMLWLALMMRGAVIRAVGGQQVAQIGVARQVGEFSEQARFDGGGRAKHQHAIYGALGQQDRGDAVEHVALAGAGRQVERGRELIGQLQVALHPGPRAIAPFQDRVVVVVAPGQAAQVGVFAAEQVAQRDADGVLLVFARAA